MTKFDEVCPGAVDDASRAERLFDSEAMTEQRRAAEALWLELEACQAAVSACYSLFFWRELRGQEAAAQRREEEAARAAEAAAEAAAAREGACHIDTAHARMEPAVHVKQRSESSEHDIQCERRVQG